MSVKQCLNCNTEIMGAYCHQCGQKASTHRITFQHFLFHDLVHGIWHVDKGILFTIKEAFVRPGQTAMNYIQGKRIRYYNFFYLFLLILGVNLLIGSFYKDYYDIAPEKPSSLVANESRTLDITDFVSSNFKLIVFLFIPFFALNGRVIFSRIRLNMAEHFIIAGVLLLSSSIWSFILRVYRFATYKLPSFFGYIELLIIFIIALIPALIYIQAFRKQYSIGGMLWRLVSWYLLILVELLLIAFIIWLFTGKTQVVIN